jgi:hypothetical protein
MVNRQPLSHRNDHAKSSDCCRSRTVNEDSPMRNLLTLSAAASLLAIGMSAHHAAALSPGANSISPQGLVLKVQKRPPTRNGGKSGESGARGQDGGGKGAGPSATQEQGSDRGAQMRSGDKGARGKTSHQRSNVDVDVRVARRPRQSKQAHEGGCRCRSQAPIRRTGCRRQRAGPWVYPRWLLRALRRYKQCTAR